MANHKSAQKSIRKTVVRTLANRSRKNRIRTFIKKVEDAVAAGNKEQAVNALRVAQPEIMKGVTKGILHIRTAARKVSRLAARVKKVVSI